jgi:hypothetical protein
MGPIIKGWNDDADKRGMKRIAWSPEDEAVSDKIDELSWKPRIKLPPAHDKMKKMMAFKACQKLLQRISTDYPYMDAQPDALMVLSVS